MSHISKYLFIGLFLTLSAFSFCLPAQALKEESQIFLPPGTMLDNNAATVSRILKKRSLTKSKKIEVNKVQVSLVHYHYMEPDQFGILLKVANSVSGCFNISPLEYEANFIDEHYMDIKIKDFRRVPIKTKGVSYDCNVGSKVVSGLIVISAKDLKKKEIKQIRFSNGNIRDAYNVTILPDSIQLKPDSMVAFKAIGLVGVDKDRLTHYFSGKALVALHVPMARDGENIAQHVRNLAYKSALTPVFEKEGLDTSGKNNVFYFTDPHGTALDMLGESAYMELGNIQVARPYDSPNGRAGLPVPLRVFLTRPGTTL